MSDDIRSQYDGFAERYDEIFGARQRDKIIKLAAYVPRPWPTPCLDAGSGTGIATRVLSHPFVNIDLSPAMLAQAPPPRIIGDITELPFPESTFGFVLCVSVIDHRVDHAAAINEFARVLKPGGYLALSILKSEDIAAAEWALKTTFGELKKRLDLGPDIGLIVQRP
jgi:ubiquinone/menaquinone biosynthesis C-methylase UbiE